MKNYNLKPLYIFLAIFATAWIVKLNISPKEIKGTENHYRPNGKFEQEAKERSEEIKHEMEEIQKNTHKDTAVVYPGYNL